MPRPKQTSRPYACLNEPYRRSRGQTKALQRWYNLSDAAVEEALCDRFSFVRFVGLSLDHDEVPDATTICRFRQSLVERNIFKRLLDKLNHQLERRGLLVREGAIVDASIVSSARRPLKVLDVLPKDREEDSGDAPDVTISYSDDADAAYLGLAKVELEFLLNAMAFNLKKAVLRVAC
ncbi:MAG: transposase [Solidesulfovibrio sp. DCME]|uniref:transposase n=1 Tax=Solidesulfovibrio sp. DCME TaxID=3447380 RepID=UPI003D0FA8B1